MNIQQVIVGGIKELLYEHNFMVLPGFGGFVLKHTPASLHPERNTLQPPSKTPGFNIQLKQNDGLLSQWLQNRLQVTQIQAMAHISDFVDYCNSVLQTKRRITFNGIGFFYIDFEGSLCFEPERELNFSRESFGLSTLTLKPLAQVRRQEPVFTDRVMSGAKTSDLFQRKPQRRSYLVPSMLGIFLFLLLSAMLVVFKTPGVLEASFYSDSRGCVYRPGGYLAPQLPTIAEPAPYVADANGFALMQLGESRKVVVKVFDSNDFVEAGSPRYEIVLGCFSIRGNAQKLIKKLDKENIRARISATRLKGLSVVSHGSFSTREAAGVRLQQVQEKHPSAWLREL